MKSPALPVALAWLLALGTIPIMATVAVPDETDVGAEAWRAYRGGELDRAERLLRAALARSSGDASLHFLLGLVLRDGSPARPDEAATAFRAALSLEPDRKNAVAALADVLLDFGHGDQAERFLRGRLRDHPDEAVTLRLLGAHLTRDDRAEEGFALLEHAATLDPRDPPTWLELGRARLRAGEAKAAVASLERARDLAPDSPGIRYNLAQAYLATERDDEGAAEMEAYDRLRGERADREQETRRVLRLHRGISLRRERLRSDPDRPAGDYADLVALHAEADTLAGARTFFRELAAEWPDLAAPLVGLALVARRDDPGAAWDLLREAREREPLSPGPLRVLSDLADTPERRQDLAGILGDLERRPDAPPDVPLLLGLMALDEGRLEEAEEALNRARTLLPDDPEMLMNLGVVYGRTGRHREAIVLFHQLVRLRPGDGEAWFNMALSEAQLGELDAARDHLRRALDAGPPRPRILNLLARILEFQGRRDEATAALKRSLELDPEQPRFREMLDRLLAGPDGP